MTHNNRPPAPDRVNHEKSLLRISEETLMEKIANFFPRTTCWPDRKSAKSSSRQSVQTSRLHNDACEKSDRSSLNICSRLAEIRVSISPGGIPLLADEEQKGSVQAYLRGILVKKGDRREKSNLYVSSTWMIPERSYLSASRGIAKVHYATRKLQVSVRFPRNHACHMYATRLSRNDSRDDCTRIIVELIIDLETTFLSPGSD